MSNERHFPPGTVPAFAALTGLLVGAAFFLALAITRCSPEPVQMIPPVVTSTSTATASAQVIASQSVRVTVRRAPTASQPQARQDAQQGPLLAHQVSQDPARREVEGDVGKIEGDVGEGEEIVIEISQGVIGGADSLITDPLIKNPAGNLNSDHGRLGVIAATMPGILAADLQLVRLDVSPVTRLLADVDMEVGADLAGNLEAGAVGVSAGGKAFALAGVWSRWDMRGQGVALAAGLRF